MTPTDRREMGEIQPCPLCEGTAKPHHTSADTWQIVCDSCDAAGPIKWDKNDAIKEWNQRPAVARLTRERDVWEEKFGAERAGMPALEDAIRERDANLAAYNHVHTLYADQIEAMRLMELRAEKAERLLWEAGDYLDDLSGLIPEGHSPPGQDRFFRIRRAIQRFRSVKATEPKGAKT